MSRKITVDLTTEVIKTSNSKSSQYGRGLAVQLLRKHTPTYCSRLDSANALVIVPGLFTGCHVPCANRATVAARGDEQGVMAFSITGDLPQKLSSLGISALVIKGASQTAGAVVYIDESEIKLLHLPELIGATSDNTIEHIRSKFGSDCAIAGCGPTGEMMLPLSGLFTTYPEGTPRYTCPRSSFGDVAGSKGLKAIVVKHSDYFGAQCVDSQALLQDGKNLARYILDDPICGGALPGLGSITLLHLLQSREQLPKLPQKRESVSFSGHTGRVNYCCAPGCVIGCLNRHSANSSNGKIYTSPAEVEVQAAMKENFGGIFTDDEINAISTALTKRGLQLGLNTVEFVCTAAMYYRVTNALSSVTHEKLTGLMDEIAQGSVTGRLLGTGTVGLSRLYRDDKKLQLTVTRPATEREKDYALRLRMQEICPEVAGMDALELLYRQIFLLENLGLCIFSSFALLNRPETLELLAKIYTHKTGAKATIADLLNDAGKCLRMEEALSRSQDAARKKRSIPEFVKVLYRYFEP